MSDNAKQIGGIFSDAGNSEAWEAIERRQVCKCGQRLKFRPRDIGRIVPCPKCHKPLRIGKSLKQRPSTTPNLEPVETDAASADRPTSRRSLAAYGVIVASVALGLVVLSLTTDLPAAVMRTMAPLLDFSAGSGDAGQFDPNSVTVANINALLHSPLMMTALTQADYWQAELREAGVASDDARVQALGRVIPHLLAVDDDAIAEETRQLIDRFNQAESAKTVQFWIALLRRYQVSDDDPRLKLLLSTHHKLEEELNPVTLESINRLLDIENAADAHDRAQRMLMRLNRMNVDAKDERRLRLEDVTPQLVARLAEEAMPRQEVAEFHALLDSLQDHLKQASSNDASRREHLNKAGKVVAQCEQMMMQHGEMLKEESLRLMSLKEKLRQLTLLGEGAEKIAAMLDACEQAIESAEVGRALDAYAEARFRAEVTPLTASAANELQTRAFDIKRQLMRARGGRAVRNTQLAAKANDAEGVKLSAKEAHQYLDEAKDAQSKHDLRQIDGLAKKHEKRRDSAAVAERIKARRLYEQALDHYAALDFQALTATALQLHQLHIDGSASAEAYHDKVGQLLLRLIEHRVSPALLAAEKITTQEDAELPQGDIDVMLDAAGQIDQLTPWADDPQWHATQTGIDQQMNRLAQRNLAAVRELLRREGGNAQSLSDEHLEWAAAQLDVSLILARGDVTPEAREVADLVRKERDDRIHRNAEREAWQRIVESSRNNDSLQTWILLTHYVNQFGAQSTREFTALRQRVHPQAIAQTRVALHECEDYLEQSKWDQARAALQRASMGPPAKDITHRIGQVEQFVANLTDRAREEFRGLGSARQLRTTADVIAVSQAMPKILAMDPEFEKAKRLARRARSKAVDLAQQYIRSAESFVGENTAVAKEKLETVKQLDPDGKYGAQADDLLNNL